jgi:hypothetical protein
MLRVRFEKTLDLTKDQELQLGVGVGLVMIKVEHRGQRVLVEGDAQGIRDLACNLIVASHEALERALEAEKQRLVIAPVKGGAPQS